MQISLFLRPYLLFSLLIPFFISFNVYAQDVPIQNDDVISRLNEWELLTSSSSNHYPTSRYANFLKNTTSWPLEKRIEWRYEHALSQETDDHVLENLCPTRPLNQLASLMICERFLPHLIDDAKRIWIHNIFSESDEDAFLSHYANNITPQDDWERFEHLLTLRHKPSIERQISRLHDTSKLLATALFKAKFSPKDSLAFFNTLPETIKTQNTLLIAQLHALRSLNDLEGARIFWRQYDSHFLNQTTYFQNLWLSERVALARMILFQDGSHLNELEKETLLQLTNIPHISNTNIQQQDALLLQSYIYILYTNNADNALQNLKPLLSSSIISRRSEALFLSAEAEKTLNHEENYQKLMSSAAHYPTSFYGQFSLALLTHSPFLTSYERSSIFLEKIKEELTNIPKLPTSTPPRKDLIEAATLLANKGDFSNATLFLSFLIAQKLNNAQLIEVSNLAQKLHLPKISILIGRKLSLKGIILYPNAYPFPYDKRLFPSPPINSLPSGLFEALIRQESSADPDAISPAHAIGLTQILLGTAIQTAHKHHLSFPLSLNMTTLANPSTNLTLGQYYLGDLWKRFNNNIMLTLAAYNAGPHRVEQWNFPNIMPIAPFNGSDDSLREREMQALHWLITLPYAETRIYINHIMTDMTIYALQ